MQNTALLIDFGSPHTQKLAQQIRSLKVYCEIVPYNRLPDQLNDYKAIILTDVQQPEQIKFEFPPTKSAVLSIGHSKKLIKNRTDVAIDKPDFYRSEKGRQTLVDFLLNQAELKANWTPEKFIENAVRQIQEEIGHQKVVLGLSGGVDSTVTAVLLNQALGENLYCIFVDHGLLRKNEFSSVLEQYKDMGLNVKGVNASQRFLTALQGISDPEEKRKIIGRLFIEVFDEEAQKIKDVRYLAQGTIYPDIIESVSIDGKVAVKSHHNVGGLPEKMNLKIVEPLRSLFKDEVRNVGKAMNIHPDLIGRHPFPGPGLAIRILGAVTAEKIKMVQEADAIFINKLREAGIYDKVWQAGAILLPVNSVGKSNDKRTYEQVIALRAVNSNNGMTADWIDFPYKFLQQVSTEIIEQVKGINRVVYDISSKPPATIEWE